MSFKSFDDARDVLRAIMPGESRQVIDSVAADWFGAGAANDDEPDPPPQRRPRTRGRRNP